MFPPFGRCAVEGRTSNLARSLAANIWLLICAAAAASGIIVVVRVMRGATPVVSDLVSPRIGVSAAPLFGALAGLYGIVATVLLTVRTARLKSARSAVRRLQRRTDDMESQRSNQQTRVEELSTLREVATVVNQESDFSIIAGKALELIHGLFEPLDATLFLHDDESGKLGPFAQYVDGSVLTDRKVLTRSIPNFDLSEFESHSVVCRIHGQELHAIVPLKVEEKTLGILLLVFLTDGRPAEVQTAEFNKAHRRALVEIVHHLSLAVKTKHLHTKAVVDGLTRLYSRSHFNAQFAAAVDFAKRNQEPFSLVMIDIDHFKRINDRHGHATGDAVLSRLAKRIKGALRKYDTAYRYGGEELGVLLPRTRMRQAIRIAERIRTLVERQKFRGAHGKLVKVTVSMGVAQFESRDNTATLFERADQRLYRAKDEGRNRVVPAAA